MGIMMMEQKMDLRDFLGMIQQLVARETKKMVLLLLALLVNQSCSASDKQSDLYQMMREMTIPPALD